ncbi:MAG: sulfatase-like hydrolase/transferase, partial [Sedimentisphaerales bacterium]|nr:sulfatase-like hydrolase/transferase [Sedimentisphaerales bacterium]
MNRRTFLQLAGLGVASLGIPGCAQSMAMSIPPGRKPNILFLFADDQCFETLHAMGCDEIETPNLDRLVRKGTTFTHAYNMGAWHGAVCVASRTMLNTGRFLWNAREIEPSLLQEAQAGRLWSQCMSRAGYETYFSGKWHVKIKPEEIFDHVIHERPGMPNQTPQGYNRPIEGQVDPWKPWDTQWEGYWKGGRHWSEVLGDDGAAFLNQAAGSDKPFFMYLAFNAPHDPRQSPKEYVDKYPLDKVRVPSNFQPLYPYKDDIGCGEDLRDEKLAPFPRTEYAVKVNRQEYYAIITHMDAQIGRLLDTLEAGGQADNTYIFFTADHGLAVGHHGLIGKQNMYDHSVRVPLMVCGPGIKGGIAIDSPVYLQDIMPTSLELAGADRPESVEFRSLLPLLGGHRKSNYDHVYGGYMMLQRMVCDGRYKMIYYPKIEKVLLFDL